MNVTLVPEQIVLPGFAAMFTAGTTVDDMFIVTALEIAVAGLAQFAVDVITTVIISPFTNVLFE